MMRIAVFFGALWFVVFVWGILLGEVGASLALIIFSVVILWTAKITSWRPPSWSRCKSFWQRLVR